MLASYPFQHSLTEQGNLVLQSVDIPGVLTYGADEPEARAMAQDALLTMIDHLIKEKAEVPKPSKPGKGDLLIPLPLLPAAKLAIYWAMREQRWSQVALAKELGVDPKQVQRMLNIQKRTGWTHVEEALACLGLQASLDLQTLRGKH